MSKNTRYAQQKVVRKAAKRAEKAKASNKPQAIRAREYEKREKKRDLSFYSSGAYQFWLCHGANYLNSDYSTGKWEPLYPDIYQGTLMPNVNDIFPLIGQKFFADGVSSSPKGPRILSWMMANVRMVRTVAKKLEDFTSECKNPHHTKVWEFFAALEGNIQNMLAKKDELSKEEEVSVRAGGPWPEGKPYQEPKDRKPGEGWNPGDTVVYNSVEELLEKTD